MYDEGHSLDQIKAYLESKSIKTPTGKPVWSKENIRKMLTNEKYVGDVIYQKTFRTDCISKHTKINRSERTKYLVSNNHPAIVDRDLFNAVQAEIARRSSKRRTSDKTLTSLGKYSGKYALSELLICAECGSPYKRKTWTQGDEKRIYWRCLSRIEHGKKYCPYSKGLEENKLHSAICRALKAAMNENAEALALIKANLAYAVTRISISALLKNVLKKQPRKWKTIWQAIAIQAVIKTGIWSVFKALPMKLKPCVFNLKLQSQSLKSATRQMPRLRGSAIGWIAMTLHLLIMMTS